MKTYKVRQAFIDYFVSKGHKHIASSSTVPYDDPSLLFTNAGMNQFKNYFLGTEKPPYLRAVSAQKVIRAGGKHNDLENVGRTARHHTFFEMLGNFSFGDYFKEQAIIYAWEFLTKIIKIPAEKLAVSVYKQDDESFRLWCEKTSITPEKIAKLGEKDNFWTMGDMGPCGPCSEIHYDLYGKKKNRTIIESLEQDDGRFLEIWNLVFMQFDRKQDGTLVNLPAPSVDTGMGLERVASVLQQVNSNYKTDIFTILLDFIAQKGNYSYGKNENLDISVRVIADHLRSSSIIIADGILPSNEGRGYVLRRIIRRALRHAKYLQQPLGSFAECSVFFSEQNKDIFPELLEQKDWIYKILLQEEKRFTSTLENGLKILTGIIQASEKEGKKEIQGHILFKLYDTYGFPMELTEEILAEKKISYNKQQFETAMQKQKEIARKGQIFRQVKVMKPLLDIQDIFAKEKQKNQNNFCGYEKLQTKSKISYLWNENELLKKIELGQEFYCLLQKNPFYAESGGQVGDIGWLKSEDFTIRILDSQKSPDGIYYSRARLEKTNSVFQQDSNIIFEAQVDQEKRQKIQAHHTSTHLLNSALREVLGTHIKQAGSLVNEQKLRFDFQHFEAIPLTHLIEIEELVNEYIRKNEPVIIKTMPLEQALSIGALAFFEEKYANTVRVVQAGSHSKELCGGCHTQRTGDLGFFHLLTESSSAAGIRRIEAVAFSPAWQERKKSLQKFQSLYKTLGLPINKIVSMDSVIKSAAQKIEQLENLEKQNQSLQKAIQKNFLRQITQNNQQKKGLFFLENSTIISGKLLLDAVMQKFQPKIAVLYTKNQDSLELLLAKNKKLENFHCGKYLKENSNLLGAKGGGSEFFAQCKGSKEQGLQKIQMLLEKIVENQ